MTEKFREYLLGQKYFVFTDNNPLSHLASAKLGDTEQHWAAPLASFDFEVIYRSGKSNKNESNELKDESRSAGSGLLFYIRECGRRDRDKIQDLWSSVAYHLVKAPKEGGAVYLVAPVSEPDKVKHVHRSLLKARNQKEPYVHSSQGSPPAQQVLS